MPSAVLPSLSVVEDGPRTPSRGARGAVEPPVEALEGGSVDTTAAVPAVRVRTLYAKHSVEHSVEHSV